MSSVSTPKSRQLSAVKRRGNFSRYNFRLERTDGDAETTLLPLHKRLTDEQRGIRGDLLRVLDTLVSALRSDQ